MRRTNRVEPVTTDSDAGDLARATVTTTTRMEFVRRVQVLPMEDAVAQLHGDLNQSLAGEVTVSPRIWEGMQRPATAVTVRNSRRGLWCIGCIFITVGLFSLCAMIAGLTLAFGKTNAVGESDIERYDLGDLYYGINNVDTSTFPSNTYLSSENKVAVQKYLADQLINESGYRGLFINGVLVQQQPANGRKRRATSCDAIFIVQNIQVYFDYCSTCAGSRNLALRRSFSNITAFQQPLSLLINNGSTSTVATQVCSAPALSRLIVPVRLSILQAQQIDSSLLTLGVHPTTMDGRSTYPTSTYSVRPSTGRSSYIFTSRGISTQKTKTRTTTTTSTLPPMETSLPIVTTIVNDISTVISTIPLEVTTDAIMDTSTKQTESSTAFNEIDKTTSSTDSSTTSETTADAATTARFEDTTLSLEKTTTSEEFQTSTLSTADFTVTTADETSTSEQTEQTVLSSDQSTTSISGITSSSTESFSIETSSFDANTATKYNEVTSPSSIDLTTSGETSTLASRESTTINDASETTPTDNFEELTSSPTSEFSTIRDVTMVSDFLQTTTSQKEETSSATTLVDFLTKTSSAYDSTTTGMEIDTSSSLYDDSTTTKETQSSTVSAYTEETSLSPVYLPTTIKPITTKTQSSVKSTAAVTSSRRQTTKKIIPFLSYKPSLSTSSVRSTSPQQTTRVISSLTSIKPGRTRKQTYYSTILIPPTTQRYGTSRAITPTNIYRPTTVKRGGRFTTAATPLASTGRTNARAYTTATFPLTTGTQQRGRFKSTIGKSRQSTNNPTSPRPRTTTSTRQPTTFLPISTMEPYYTSYSSTDAMAIGSTISSNVDVGLSSTSSSMERDSFTTVPPISIDFNQSSSSTNKYESTEPLLTLDLTSATADQLSTDESYTTSSKLETTTTVVSTSDPILTSRLLDNSTEQQRLHSSSFTTTALSTNAYIESSSMTSLLITHSTIPLTSESHSRSTELLQTLFDTSFSTTDQSVISVEDSSQFQSLTTTISTTVDTKSTTLDVGKPTKFTTLINQDTSSHQSSEWVTTAITPSTLADAHQFSISERSSNPSSEDDHRFSTNSQESPSTEFSKMLSIHTTPATGTDTNSNFTISSISSLTHEDVSSSTKIDTLSTTMSVAITTNGFLSTFYKPQLIESSVHILTSNSHSNQLSTTTQNSVSSQNALLDITTSTDLPSSSSGIGTDMNSVPSFDITTPTSQLNTAENAVTATQSSFSRLALHSDPSTLSGITTNQKEPNMQTVSTSSSQLTEILTDTVSSSTTHSVSSSSQTVSTTDMTIIILSTSTSTLLVETSLESSSIVTAFISDTTVHQTHTSAETVQPISTVPVTTSDDNYMTSKTSPFTTSESSKPDLTSSQFEQTITQSVFTTNDNTIEDASRSTEYSTFVSSSAISITDPPFTTINSVTESSTGSSMSSSSDEIFTTSDHVDRVSTLSATAVKDDATSTFVLSSTPLSITPPSIMTSLTVNSITSTMQSFPIESTVSSSKYLSSTPITSSDLQTAVTSINTNTITVLSTTDASTIDNRPLSTDGSTIMVSPPSAKSSHTYQTLTQIVLTTHSSSSDTKSAFSQIPTMTSSQPYSSTSTELVTETDTVTTDISSSSSSHTISSASISMPNSNFMTTTIDTAVNSSTASSTSFSTASVTDDATIKTSILTHSPTDINNDLISTMLLSPTARSQQTTNDELSTLSILTDDTDLTSSSSSFTFDPLTLHSSSVTTPTSEISQDQGNVNQLSTLPSLVQDSNNTSTASVTSVRVSSDKSDLISTLDYNADSTVAQTSFKTSPKEDASIDVTTTVTPTLTAPIEYVSTSTATSPNMYSEYTNDKITTQSTTVDNNYERPISTSSKAFEIGTTRIIERSTKLATSTADDTHVLTTSLTSAIVVTTASSSLTSLDEVSNIRTVTSTSTNDPNTITTSSEVFNENLSRTLDRESKTSSLPEISTDFAEEPTLVTTSMLLFNEPYTTTTAANDYQSTVSQGVFRTVASSAHSLSAQSITTQSSDSTLVTSIHTTHGTPEMSSERTQILSTTDDTLLTSLTPVSQSIETHDASSSSREHQITSSSIRILDATLVQTPETSQTTSQRNIDSSETTVIVPLTTEDTTKYPSTINPSTSENIHIIRTTSDSSKYFLFTTSRMFYESSTILTTITNNDQSSSLPSTISSTGPSIIDSITSGNIAQSNSQTNAVLSTKSNLSPTIDMTSTRLLSAVASVSNTVESRPPTSTNDVYTTDLTSTRLPPTIVSSSNDISSPSDTIIEDPISSTQITQHGSSSPFTVSAQTRSATLPSSSIEMNMTVSLVTTTAIAPSSSMLFTSDPTDNPTVTASQNAADTETTIPNMMKSMLPSISNSFTRVASTAGILFTQSSQSSSSPKTSSSDTTETTSDSVVTVDHSTSSQSSHASEVQMSSYTNIVTQSKDTSKQTTFSTTTLPILSSLLTNDASPQVIVTTSPAGTSTSSISHSTSIVTDSSRSETSSTNPATLSSSQSSIDSTTEKFNHASDSTSFTPLFISDRSSLQLSTANDITSSESAVTDIVSSNIIQLTESPSISIQLSSLSHSSVPPEYLDTTTRLTNETAGKISERYTTAQPLSPSLSSSQPVSTTDTTIVSLNTTTSTLLVETSVEPSSVVTAFIPDTTVHQTHTSAETVQPFSTVPLTTSDDNYMTSKTSTFTTSETSQTDFTSSQFERTTTYSISTTNDNTIEDASRSTEYTTFLSSSAIPKYATSTDTVIFSSITDVNTATKISTVDLYSHSNSKTDGPTSIPITDPPLPTINNVTGSSTAPSVSSSSDEIFTTSDHVDKVSTLSATATKGDATSAFALSSTPVPDTPPSTETDTTVKSIISTMQSFPIESTVSSSTYSSSTPATSTDLQTPISSINRNTITMLSTTDVSTIDNRPLSTNGSTIMVSPPSAKSSHTYQTLTQIVLTTHSSSSDTKSAFSQIPTMTSSQPYSSTSTELVTETDTVTTDISSSSSSHTISSASISMPNSNFMTTTIDTAVNSSTASSTSFSTASVTDDATIKTSILTHSPTDINNDLISTMLLSPTARSQQTTNDELSTLSILTDDTDLTSSSSSSTFGPLTLHSSSVTTPTSEISQDQENVNQLPTLPSIVQDFNNTSAASSISVRVSSDKSDLISTLDYNADSTITQTSFKTSSQADTSIDVTTTVTPTLTSHIEYVSTSTASSPNMYSEYTNDKITAQSTTVENTYERPTSASSQASEIGTTRITEQSTKLATSTADDTHVLTTSLTSAIVVTTASSSLTSLDEVSNIRTVTSTSTNDPNTITTSSKVFNENLSSTLDRESKTSSLPEISTDFAEEPTLVTTSMLLFNERHTTAAANDDQSTVSQGVFRTVASSAHSLSAQSITTQSSDSTALTSIHTTHGPSETSSERTQILSTTDDTLLTSLTPVSQSIETHDASSSSREHQITSSSIRILDATLVQTPETSQTTSQRNIDSSETTVIVPLTTEDTTKYPSTINPSTSENTHIITRTSDSSKYFLFTTSRMFYEYSTILTTITNNDQSSSLPSTISSTGPAIVDSTTSANIGQDRSSQTNAVLSTKSNLSPTIDMTSTSLLSAVASVSNTVESQLPTSTNDVYTTDLTSTQLPPTIVSSSNDIASTSDTMMRDLISITQITQHGSSALFTDNTQTRSATLPSSSNEMNMTVSLVTTTLMTPSSSALFISDPPDPTDNPTVTTSQNAADTETTIPNMMNSMLSTVSHSFSKIASTAGNLFTQSSQSSSLPKTSSSDTTETTSDSVVTVDHSTSSQSSHASEIQMSSYTNIVTHSKDTSKQTTFSTTTLPILSSLLTNDASPQAAVMTSPAGTSTSSISHSTSIVMDSSRSETFSTNPATLSSSQSSIDSTTEKFNHATDSTSFTPLFISDRSSLQSSTANDIISLESAVTDIVSSNRIQLTKSPSISVQSSSLSQSSVPPEYLDTSTRLTDETASKISERYTTAQSLSSSVSSKQTNETLTSTISSTTVDTLEDTSTDGSKFSASQLPSANLFSTQISISTSKMESTAGSKTTFTPIDIVSSNQHISSSPSASFSNDITDQSKQQSTTLPFSSDHTSLKGIFYTNGTTLTLSTIDSSKLYTAQTMHSTATTSSNPDQSFSSIQSRLISSGSTSSGPTERLSSTILSSTELLNITSVSP